MSVSPDIRFPAKPLVAKSLACRRSGRMVFEGLSFRLEAGSYLHLKGRNGSGKSTLLRLLAGLLPAQSGALLWGDDAVLGPQAAQSEAMIYSGHQHGLKSVFTLAENVGFLYKLMSGSDLDEETLEQAAQGFGLLPLLDQPLKYFSSGQTHRAALMRFLLLGRPIWLMDEPTVGLDTENRARLQAIMEAHLARGGMILAASHDPIGLEGGTLQMTDFAPKANTLEGWE